MAQIMIEVTPKGSVTFAWTFTGLYDHWTSWCSVLEVQNVIKSIPYLCTNTILTSGRVQRPPFNTIAEMKSSI